MIFAVVAQAAVFAGVLIYVIRHFSGVQQQRDRAHTEQVAELLTRIQHPERIPVRTVEWSRRPERERDGLHKVGRIEVDE